MRKILIGLLLLGLVSCDTKKEPPKIPPGDTFVSCVHKYDTKIILQYFESQSKVVIPNNVDIKQYQITDIDGDRHQISEQEWDAYICKRTKNEVNQPVDKKINEKTDPSMLNDRKFNLKPPKSNRKFVLPS